MGVSLNSGVGANGGEFEVIVSDLASVVLLLGSEVPSSKALDSSEAS